MKSRFTKIGSDGMTLGDETTEWVAVLDNVSTLIWSVKETKAMSWKQSQQSVEKLIAAGFSDWRLPTVEELFLLADRTKHSPAIDTSYFPDCKSNWYWTSTPFASSPSAGAWLVGFSSGYSYWFNEAYEGDVRAVRASQS